MDIDPDKFKGSTTLSPIDTLPIKEDKLYIENK